VIEITILKDENGKSMQKTTRKTERTMTFTAPLIKEDSDRIEFLRYLRDEYGLEFIKRWSLDGGNLQLEDEITKSTELVAYLVRGDNRYKFETELQRTYFERCMGEMFPDKSDEWSVEEVNEEITEKKVASVNRRLRDGISWTHGHGISEQHNLSEQHLGSDHVMFDIKIDFEKYASDILPDADTWEKVMVVEIIARGENSFILNEGDVNRAMQSVYDMLFNGRNGLRTLPSWEERYFTKSCESSLQAESIRACSTDFIIS